MLELRALDAKIDGLCRGGVELRFGLRDVLIRRDACVMSDLRKLERFLIGEHGCIQQLLLPVQGAKLKIIRCHFGSHGQPHIFEIGEFGLRFERI